jgi:hypothetical protein
VRLCRPTSVHRVDQNLERGPVRGALDQLPQFLEVEDLFHESDVVLRRVDHLHDEVSSVHLESLHAGLSKIAVQIRREFVLFNLSREVVYGVGETVRRRAPVVYVEFDAEIVPDAAGVVRRGQHDPT